MRLPHIATSFVDSIKSCRLRTKFLVALWALFLVLVALGIHGSSIGVTARWWAPEKPYAGYLFDVPDRFKEQASPVDDSVVQSVLMRNARLIRWDELTVATPLALGQFSHKPRFPVVNTNIGNGQNMLVSPHAPVLHIVTLARPATWGYFLFGTQRGLAWYWWFQPFACFTMLWLLFEVALGGHSKLAAFGAFWFCNSAYVICWSQWPDHVIFFAALGCLAAYHLVSSDKRSVRATSAILLGLSFPGFLMIMYPAWQVPAAYFVLFLFASVLVRDKLYISLKTRLRERLAYIAAAAAIALVLSLAWLVACLPDLKAMSDAVYPGRRISLGGDYSLALLFKGLYNFATIYNAPAALGNQSEAASFYYLFPAVLIGLCFSRAFARNLGVVGWVLVGYISAALIFLFAGLPSFLAKLTLLSYVPSYRADLTIGLASILLSMRVLSITKSPRAAGSVRWERIWPWLAGGAVSLLFALHAVVLIRQTSGFPSRRVALLTVLLGGIASYLLLSGHRRLFCSLTGAAVVATTFLFNPLSTDLGHIYDSELSREISELNRGSNPPPLWVCYGGIHTGVLVTVLGGKSVSGVQFPPQLSMWHTLDPDRVYERFYNQYAEVSLDYLADASRVSFSSPHNGELRVFVSPNYPRLRALGARYLLLADDAQQIVPTHDFRFISKAGNGNFSIFEFPASTATTP